jgi:tetratricopeptide (TPR) repeat protein
MIRETEQHQERARQLLAEDKPESALEFFDKVLSATDATAADLATALKDKAVALASMGRIDEARELFEEVIRSYQYSINQEEKHAVDKSLYNMAVMRQKGGQAAEATEFYQKVVTRNANSSDSKSQRLVAQSLLHKGNLLNRKESSYAQAIACFDLILKRFGTTDDPGVAEVVLQSLLCKAFAHVMKDRAFPWATSDEHREAVFPIIDKAIAISSRYNQSPILLLGARAIRMKAHLLGKLDRMEEKEQCWGPETLVKQFGAAKAEIVGKFIEMERNLQAMTDFVNLSGVR